ncbi:MAG: XrtB/PEP-CTERM-associated polysaccharide biosynthesis outer membrane protein EpsL [Porticoccaceae bacterium]
MHIKSLKLGIAAIALFPASFEAFAGKFDPVTVDVGTSVRYDDNFYRLSSSADSKALTGQSSKSEQIISPFISLGLNKEYSLQKIEAKVTATNRRYQENGSLDFNSLDYDAAWLWRITPSFGGRILVARTEALNDFGDYTNFATRSIRTIDTELLELEYLLGGAWSVVGGASRQKIKNSATFAAQDSEELLSQEFGGKYEFSSGTWLKLIRRDGNGDFTGRNANPISQLDSGYDLTETELSGLWRYSGKTTFDMKVANSKAEYDNFSSRNYSEHVGEVNMDWQATGKILVHSSLFRRVGSFLTNTSSYYISDGLLIAPTWRITAKTAFVLSHQYEKRKYRGAIVPTTQLREDEFNISALGVEWLPTRMSKVSATLERDQRSSDTEVSYISNALTLSAQIGF